MAHAEGVTDPLADSGGPGRLSGTWAELLADELASPTMAELRSFLQAERDAERGFLPPAAEIFRAFELTPFEEVRVVVVGQDPYHGDGQAHGLSFSVPDGVTIPPSLRNVLREIHDDLGIPPAPTGNLEPWARQGVLLLNATLTVQPHVAGSHRGKGWEQFTAAAIDALAERREGIVFLLWGRHARAAGARIDLQRHHVLLAAHPSPLSAYNGFFGCRHFSMANEILRQQGLEPLDWSLPAPMR